MVEVRIERVMHKEFCTGRKVVRNVEITVK
jgi:hypothetical protein